VLTDIACVVREGQVQHERKEGEDDEIKADDEEPPLAKALCPSTKVSRKSSK
jgi:hypothetical protein